jgi:hypothetical protein
MAIKTFTTGEVLTAADTNSFLANSGLVYVKSQTIGAGVGSVTVTDAFSATYDNYVVKINGVNINDPSSAQDGRLYLGSTTSGYKSALFYTGWNSSFSAVGITGATWYWVGVGGPNALTNISFELMQPFASTPTYLSNTPYIYDASSGNTVGIQTSSTSFTSFTFQPGAGTLTGGIITVYGYRKA